GVVTRHEQRRDASTAARETDGEGAAHRLNLAVERQLADDRKLAEVVPSPHAARRSQDRERDRQVESGSLLAQIRGGKIHGDAIVREREAGVPNGRLDALAAFAHGGIW